MAKNTEEAINRAIAAFDAADEDADNHFVETTKKVALGSGAEKNVPDYFLSRAACYVIAMNGDTSKP